MEMPQTDMGYFQFQPGLSSGLNDIYVLRMLNMCLLTFVFLFLKMYLFT